MAARRTRARRPSRRRPAAGAPATAATLPALALALAVALAMVTPPAVLGAGLDDSTLRSAARLLEPELFQDLPERFADGFKVCMRRRRRGRR